MTPFRQLVVNADDLGLTSAVNDGIFDAHDLGILTSASLFASAPATGDAIRRARTRISLGVGAHLTLVDGAPVLPAQSIPTLVTGDGRFRRSWRPFIVACLRGRVLLDEVERELSAQIERLIDAGIRLTHLDTHKHVHLYPPVFAIVARLAARFGIPVVRVPYEPGSWMNAMLWFWAQHNYRVARSLGLRTPHFVGRLATGVLTHPALHAMFQAARPGVTELMVHPGYVDDALRRMPTRLVESRLEEVALLCSMEARALLVGERLQLVRHDLARASRRSLRHVS
jgi:predicted glycoside hydrolase/deacetylase ChbG (UPF0249 family)